MPKKINRILCDGFLDFVPYLRRVNRKDPFPYCYFCTLYCSRLKPATFHYKENGKTRPQNIWIKSGWYCDVHIWDAITQHGEEGRYHRWQKKYLEAMQAELDKIPYE